MKKALIVIFVAALLCGTVYATESRVLGMGGVGLYMLDDTNVYTFPSLISSWRNEVVGELDATPNDNERRSVGINLYCDSFDLDWGLHLNLAADNYLFDDQMNQTALNRKHMLMAGKNNFGFGVALSTDGFVDDQAVAPALETEGKMLIELLGGYSMDMGDMPVDLGMRLSLPSAKQVFKGDIKDRTESGFRLNCAARGWHQAEKGTIVPVVTFGFGSGSIEQDQEKTDFSAMAIGLGMGMNHQINEDNLFILAIEPLGYTSISSEFDDGVDSTCTSDSTRMVLPAFYFGIESKITSWMTGRLGGGQVFSTTKIKEEYGSTTTEEWSKTYSDFGLAFGLGFQFGNFEIDGVFNDYYMYRGPNFVSGADANLLTRVSVKYTWGS